MAAAIVKSAREKKRNNALGDVRLGGSLSYDYDELEERGMQLSENIVRVYADVGTSSSGGGKHDAMRPQSTKGGFGVVQTLQDAKDCEGDDGIESGAANGPSSRKVNMRPRIAMPFDQGHLLDYSPERDAQIDVKKAEKGTPITAFTVKRVRVQAKMRSFYEGFTVQIVVAALIFGNFVVRRRSPFASAPAASCRVVPGRLAVARRCAHVRSDGRTGWREAV